MNDTQQHESQELAILRERTIEYRDLLMLSYILLKKPHVARDERDKYFEALEKHGILTEGQVEIRKNEPR